MDERLEKLLAEKPSSEEIEKAILKAKLEPPTPAFFIMKNEEKLNELAKTCTFEEMELGPEGHKTKHPVMTWASAEYMEFYNTEVISKAMHYLYDCQIHEAKWKKYKKEIDLYLERPGVFIGNHGELKHCDIKGGCEFATFGICGMDGTYNYK